MKIETALPRNYKRRGELVEMKFLMRASEHGLNVSKPWGDSLPYDFVVESHGRLLRVQVKSTQFRPWHTYTCQVTPACHVSRHGPCHRRHYGRNDFDFAAIYIVPEDAWFIVPIAVIARRKGGAITLSPDRPGHMNYRYLEAWYLLTDTRRRRAGQLHGAE